MCAVCKGEHPPSGQNHRNHSCPPSPGIRPPLPRAIQPDLVATFTAQQVSNCVWAYAKAGILYPRLFETLARHLMSSARGRLSQVGRSGRQVRSGAVHSVGVVFLA